MNVENNAGRKKSDKKSYVLYVLPTTEGSRKYKFNLQWTKSVYPWGWWYGTKKGQRQHYEQMKMSFCANCDSG